MRIPFPNLNVLGAGYNVFDNYADPTSSTVSIIDLGKVDRIANLGSYEYLYPENVRVISISKGKLNTIFGSDMSEYQSNYAIKAGLSGSYGFFSASIKTSYSNENYRHSFQQYFTLEDRVLTFKLILPPVDEILQNDLLTPQFKKDVTSMAPFDLFKKYGTHWVRSFINGGKGTYDVVTSKFAGRDKWQMEIDAEASYKRITGSSDVSVSSLAMSEEQFERTYETNQIAIVGGDPSKASQALNKNWSAWADTVLSNPTLIDFDTDSLVGIWELCADSKKKQELKDAYPEYAKLYPKISANDEVVLLGDYCDEYEEKWRDAGSGGGMDVTLFHPVPRLGYYVLGSVAVAGYPNKPSFKTLTVKPINSMFADALACPVDYEMIYADNGTGASQCGSIWRPIPPNGYVALGHVGQSGYNKPDLNAVRCVRKELVNNASISGLVWNDHGTHGSRDGSIWGISGIAGNVVPQGCFLGSNKYDQPSNNLTYGILDEYIHS